MTFIKFLKVKLSYFWANRLLYTLLPSFTLPNKLYPMFFLNLKQPCPDKGRFFTKAIRVEVRQGRIGGQNKGF
jgi:hypothetical protein